MIIITKRLINVRIFRKFIDDSGFYCILFLIYRERFKNGVFMKKYVARTIIIATLLLGMGTTTIANAYEWSEGGKWSHGIGSTFGHITHIIVMVMILQQSTNIVQIVAIPLLKNKHVHLRKKLGGVTKHIIEYIRISFKKSGTGT